MYAKRRVELSARNTSVVKWEAAESYNSATLRGSTCDSQGASWVRGECEPRFIPDRWCVAESIIASVTALDPCPSRREEPFNRHLTAAPNGCATRALSAEQFVWPSYHRAKREQVVLVRTKATSESKQRRHSYNIALRYLPTRSASRLLLLSSASHSTFTTLQFYCTLHLRRSSSPTPARGTVRFRATRSRPKS